MPRPKRTKITTLPRTATAPLPAANPAQEPAKGSDISGQPFPVAEDGSAGPMASTATIKSGKVSVRKFSMTGALAEKDAPSGASRARAMAKSPKVVGVMEADDGGKHELKHRWSSTRTVELIGSNHARRGSVHRAASSAKKKVVRALTKTCDPHAGEDESLSDASTAASFVHHIDNTIELVDNERDAIDMDSRARTVPPTPSMLSLANFKQRPRQPSILAMVQRSELGDQGVDDEHNIEGEDSVLAALRRSPSPSPTPSANEEDEEPANSPNVRSSASRKRKISVLEDVPPSSPPKRTSPNPNPEPQEQPAEPSPLLLSDRSPLQSPFPAHRTTEPNNLNDLPIAVPPRRSSTRRQPQPQLTRYPSPPIITATSPASTPQSSQIMTTQKLPPRRAAKEALPPKTAALQELLPKRTRTARYAQQDGDVFEVFHAELSTSDGVDEVEDKEEDELSRRPRRRKVDAKAVQPGKGRKAAGAKGKSAGKARQPLGKSPAKGNTSAATSTSTSTNANVKKTYSRRAATDSNDDEDAENDDAAVDGDADIEIVKVGARAPTKPGKLTGELKEAKEKFKVVDEWELEFESCDVGDGGRGSSPWR